MIDAADHIVEIMEAAFDPAYGEGWNRRQVSDALILPYCHYILLDENGKYPDSNGTSAGFLLSRRVADEEELLLIAVRPEHRLKGIASSLMLRFLSDARNHGINRAFLEMRDGNPAENLYRAHGFEAVGRRVNYYNRGNFKGIDAITFALEINKTYQIK